MKPFIKLGFIGIYKADFLHYLSSVFKTMGKTVLVMDASNEQHLRSTLPEPVDNEVTYRGVDFFLNQHTLEGLVKMDYKAYDICLIDYGLNQELSQDFATCDIIFVVSDYEKHHILALKGMIATAFDPSINVVHIFRDVFQTKINLKYIHYLLDTEAYAKVIAEYVLDFNEADYRCRLSCQYHEVLKFTHLTKAYKQLFADILEELYQIKRQQAMKLIKVAGRSQVCR